MAKQEIEMHGLEEDDISETPVTKSKAVAGEPLKGTIAWDRKYGKYTSKGALRKKPNTATPPKNESEEIDEVSAYTKPRFEHRRKIEAQIDKYIDPSKISDLGINYSPAENGHHITAKYFNLGKKKTVTRHFHADKNHNVTPMKNESEEIDEMDFGSIGKTLSKYGKGVPADGPKTPKRSTVNTDYTMTGHKEGKSTTGRVYTKAPEMDREPEAVKATAKTDQVEAPKRGRGRPAGAANKAGTGKGWSAEAKASMKAKLAARKAAKLAAANESVELSEAYTTSGTVHTNSESSGPAKFKVKYDDFPSKHDIQKQNPHLTASQVHAVHSHIDDHADDDMSGTRSTQRNTEYHKAKTNSVGPVSSSSMHTHKVHVTHSTGSYDESEEIEELSKDTLQAYRSKALVAHQKKIDTGDGKSRAAALQKSDRKIKSIEQDHEEKTQGYVGKFGARSKYNESEEIEESQTSQYSNFERHGEHSGKSFYTAKHKDGTHGVLVNFEDRPAGVVHDKLSKEAAVAKARHMAKHGYNESAELTEEDWADIVEDQSLDAIVEFMMDEEYQSLDELSKKTLGSYIKKAAGSSTVNATAAMHGKNREAEARADAEYYRKAKEPENAKRRDAYADVQHKASYNATEKSIKRLKGIDKATDRLTKESEDLEELSKDLLQRYQKAGDKQQRSITKTIDRGNSDHKTHMKLLDKRSKRENGWANAQRRVRSGYRWIADSVELEEADAKQLQADYDGYMKAHAKTGDPKYKAAANQVKSKMDGLSLHGATKTSTEVKNKRFESVENTAELEEAKKDSFGMPSHHIDKVKQKIRDGIWEPQTDLKANAHVEIRHTKTGKRETIHVRESEELDEAHGGTFNVGDVVSVDYHDISGKTHHGTANVDKATKGFVHVQHPSVNGLTLKFHQTVNGKATANEVGTLPGTRAGGHRITKLGTNESVELDEAKGHKPGYVAIAVNPGVSDLAKSGKKYTVYFKPNADSPRGRTKPVDISHHEDVDSAKAAKAAYVEKHKAHGVEALRGMGESTEVVESTEDLNIQRYAALIGKNLIKE